MKERRNKGCEVLRISEKEMIDTAKQEEVHHRRQAREPTMPVRGTTERQGKHSASKGTATIEYLF